MKTIRNASFSDHTYWYQCITNAPCHYTIPNANKTQLWISYKLCSFNVYSLNFCLRSLLGSFTVVDDSFGIVQCRLRQMVIVSNSFLNNTEYCLTRHTLYIGVSLQKKISWLYSFTVESNNDGHKYMDAVRDNYTVLINKLTSSLYRWSCNALRDGFCFDESGILWYNWSHHRTVFL